jgi:thymidylate synthase
MLTTSSIREKFVQLYSEMNTVSNNREGSMTNIVGNKVIELVGISFLANEDIIFGKQNHDYVEREKQWYLGKDRNINSFPGGAPEVWKTIASKNGEINSNYGWCLFSHENNNQYENVLQELLRNPQSRRAIAIYTRPTIWSEYDRDGMSDFICTNAVQYFIRDDKLHCVVQMRSNDAVIGYKNDYHWQLYVLESLYSDLHLHFDGLQFGDIIWQVGSLHVYERDFYLVDGFKRTGKQLTKKEYSRLISESK